MVWFLMIGMVIYNPIPVVSNLRIIIGIIAFWNIIDVDHLYPLCRNYFKYTFLFYSLHLVILDFFGMVIYHRLGSNATGAMINYIGSSFISTINVQF